MTSTNLGDVDIPSGFVWSTNMALFTIRLGQGKSLFFVVAILLAWVIESYSLTCSSSYTSDVLAVCHGRCGDIHRASVSIA